MMFAIKAEVSDPWAKTFAFSAQKTMYGGKHIAKGDTIFLFASENEGGPGLIASGVVPPRILLTCRFRREQDTALPRDPAKRDSSSETWSAAPSLKLIRGITDS